jgi:hypothetical protein
MMPDRMPNEKSDKMNARWSGRKNMSEECRHLLKIDNTPEIARIYVAFSIFQLTIWF